MPTANPYLPIATPDRTTAAWALVEHVSPSLACSIQAPSLAAIRAFLSDVSAPGLFLDTIAQDIAPLLSSLVGQPHAYHRSILAMQRMRDCGCPNDPVSTGSTFDAFGLAMLLQEELRKQQAPDQRDLFQGEDCDGSLCCREALIRQIVAGQFQVERRQW